MGVGKVGGFLFVNFFYVQKKGERKEVTLRRGENRSLAEREVALLQTMVSKTNFDYFEVSCFCGCCSYTEFYSLCVSFVTVAVLFVKFISSLLVIYYVSSREQLTLAV